MITEVTGFLQQTDRIVWGPWLIFLLLGCGCYLMISLFFLPLRNLFAALGLVFHPKSRKGTDGEGVSSFSALTTELAATIGTGNIVGVATAMVLEDREHCSGCFCPGSSGCRPNWWKVRCVSDIV